MYIKELKIKNFRGIRELKEVFENDIICLIGASDSTKTTILDAIEYALYPYWNINVTNTDFYNCDLSNEIQIEVTIGNLPDYFLNEDTFGLYVKKYVDDEGNDEPLAEDELFLKIQLSINEFFETEWKVITNRGLEKNINYKERAKLSLVRVGENIDKDFFIGRNSILKNYITDTKNLNSQLFDILQSVNKQEIDISSISSAFEKIKNTMNDYNIKLFDNLNLEIEMKSSDLNISNIGISDGNIPLNKKGTGTKRMLSSILNLEGNNNESCILIDEIEYGLEPYRISDLLFKLKGKTMQSIITTHSTIPITELNSNNIIICRSDNGITKCIHIPTDFQSVLRRYPYAFLSRKILITEGATELGILRAFNEKWSESGFSFAYSSGIIVDGGGGTSTISFAKKFQKLGYEVAIWIDGDDNVANKQAKQLKDIEVFKLEDSFNIEKRILFDLNKDDYVKIINLLYSLKTDDIVNYYLNEQFQTLDIETLMNKDDIELQTGLYNILVKKDSKDRDVFKGISYGVLLGRLLIELNNDKVLESEIFKLTEKVGEWCNGFK